MHAIWSPTERKFSRSVDCPGIITKGKKYLHSRDARTSGPWLVRCVVLIFRTDFIGTVRGPENQYHGPDQSVSARIFGLVRTSLTYRTSILTHFFRVIKNSKHTVIRLWLTYVNQARTDRTNSWTVYQKKIYLAKVSSTVSELCFSFKKRSTSSKKVRSKWSRPLWDRRGGPISPGSHRLTTSPWISSLNTSYDRRI